MPQNDNFQYENPLLSIRSDARKTNPRLHRELSVWGGVSLSILSGLVNQGVLEDWLDGTSVEEPDLVEYLRDYGHAHTTIRHWTKLPIKINEADAPAWREHHFGITLDEVKGSALAVLGGFLSFAGRDPERVVNLLKRQVGEQLTRLEKVPWHEFSTERVPSFEEDDDDYFEMYDMQGIAFNRPFNLFENLTYFSYGMELARLRCFDYNEEINLPNAELFKALQGVNLLEIRRRLQPIEPKLRLVQQNLARQRDGDNPIHTDDIGAPNIAWWRHSEQAGLKT